MSKKVKNININTSNLYTGVVVMITEYKEGETVPAKAMVLNKTEHSTYTGKSIRKIVYEKNSSAVDLQSRLSKKNNYSYPVIDLEDSKTLKHNTLVIKEGSSLGEVLTLAGFPKTIKTKKEIKEVFKLLSTGEVNLTLDGRKQLVNPEKAEELNKQWVETSFFHKSDLKTEPQKIEKVMKKYFK